MRFGRYGIGFLALCAVFALRARELSAQAQIISLAATSPGALTVTVTSGAIQTIAGVTDNAVNAFPSPVVIQTSWNVNPGQTNTVNLVAYFSTPAQALVGAGTQIPSGRVEGRMLTGIPTAFTAITQNGLGGVGTAGGSLRLFAVNISGANKNASRTDNLDLRLNLVGFPTLGAGAYAGVLNLRAVTQ
jgi:spore coat protein U-like protein